MSTPSGRTVIADLPFEKCGAWWGLCVWSKNLIQRSPIKDVGLVGRYEQPWQHRDQLLDRFSRSFAAPLLRMQRNIQAVFTRIHHDRLSLTHAFLPILVEVDTGAVDTREITQSAAIRRLGRKKVRCRSLAPSSRR